MPAPHRCVMPMAFHAASVKSLRGFKAMAGVRGGGALAYTLPRETDGQSAVLNRIYIVVGTLAIIILAAAFIAPNFIRWSDYRGRMEELATGMLGTPVTVRGDIEFTLLPQPRLHFDDVLFG